MRPNQIKNTPTTVQNTQEKTPVVADSNISTIHLLTKDQDIFVAERYNTEITNKEINQTGKVLKINLKKPFRVVGKFMWLIIPIFLENSYKKMRDII